MPSPKKSPSRRGRSRSPGRKVPARSSSRSRSRGRSKSPGRPRKSPSRQKTAASPAPALPEPVKAAAPAAVEEKPAPKEVVTKTRSEPTSPAGTTPTRRSARIVNQESQQEVKAVEKPGISQSNKGKTSKSKPHKYEFGGPVLTFIMTFGLPALLLYLNEACTAKSCDVRKIPTLSKKVSDYVNRDSAIAVVGFILFQALLAVAPVGRLVEGQPLKGGKRLKYRCNGLFAFAVTAVAFAVAVYTKVPLDFAVKNFRQLTVTAILFSVGLSVCLFIRSRKLSASEYATNTGCLTYDFFMGRELNPRFGPLDLKFFFELRPGLIGWAVLNGCFLASAYSKGPLNPALVLVAAGQMVYVVDALIFEDAILSTMDITTEGFGYMLAFGDVAWVPFIYCLQVRYLFLYPQTFSNYILGLILLLNVVGYLIFRGSNSQKSKFRQDPQSPSLAHLETIPTPSGRKLLASGWWGLCRHPNYLGDLLMSLSWSLYCGFGSVIPYFYPIYFFVLLAHRQRRDDGHCRQKHGAAWDRYCEKVKYRIIPYVY